MASSDQVREWWAGYQHDHDRYVRVDFPGVGRVWSLEVADRSRPVWEAVAQIMATEPYLFRESAGGTYSRREPGSQSLHTYALALDLNPSKNPMQPPPLVYDYPETFIERVEGIRANGLPAIKWGGRFPASNPPDTMHWQINVAPEDCKGVTWDHGSTDMPLSDDDIRRIWEYPVPDEDDGTGTRGAVHALRQAWKYSKQAATRPLDGGLSEDQVKAIVNGSAIVAPD